MATPMAPELHARATVLDKNADFKKYEIRIPACHSHIAEYAFL
jgi:hypothetical protein